ncbi:hypothetical protein TNCV_3238051 [Trichonephila clavipes]|nr:hypothetical protein TNCV_3238051 [Trichonephila clavipes]
MKERPVSEITPPQEEAGGRKRPNEDETRDRVVVYSASVTQVWGSINGQRKVDSAFHPRYIGSIHETWEVERGQFYDPVRSFCKEKETPNSTTVSYKIAQGNSTASRKRLISWFLLDKVTELGHKIVPVRPPKF